MKNVGIISCDKWMNKITEDLLLKQELMNNNLNVEIISWEDMTIDYSKYDCLILRSVWGYQDKYLEFKEWLQMIKNKNILLLNHPDIIINNIQKNKQFSILKKNNIPFIDTSFVYTEDDLLERLDLNRLTVIKPIISGSGKNTYLINQNDLSNLRNILNGLKNVFIQNDNGIMIQPYFNGIENGEYACIEEFSDYLYMRVDIVLQNGNPIIMEVELAEPDLLFKYIENDSVRNQGIKLLSKSIVRRIK